MNFRDRILRFMYGRYGGRDELNRLLWIITVILLLLSMISRISLFYWGALVVMIYCYFRMMSRNIPKRYAENQKFLKATAKIRGKLFWSKEHMRQRRYYAFYRCTHCGQKVRVPKGKGRIEITCPKCHTRFIKTT
ncbi:zinc ribbon-containing protein [Eubacterium oxidoreducens]|uniref:Zn-finger containing protein n=1 Tax=Eubacterium oxidoreducens TaxID=1732 RepID=A0A1G6BLU0_EUBOX|nr:zinc ribbon-containing protein [Eubacterium oxidoreducens]SDB21572.1 hypothetical protein SAMN02910417_01616 [Eubacterium oxidoreducens]